MNETGNYLNVENTTMEPRSVHWRGVFAGVFVAMLTYFVLMSLGLAICAGQVKDMIQGVDAGRGLSAGAGIWLLVTVLISLFVGSYASSRVSGLIVTRVGYTQGAVIAALFFTLMLTQAGIALSALTSGLGVVKDAAGGAVSQAMNSDQLNAIVDDAMGDLNFRSPPQIVSAGILSRLLRGDSDSAITYLSVQTGMSRADAQARLENVANQVKTTAADLGQRSADAARALGWSSFVTMLLGSLAAMFGGAIGAQINIRRPVDEMDRKASRHAQQPRPACT
jgi:hypothetical protein